MSSAPNFRYVEITGLFNQRWTVHLYMNHVCYPNLQPLEYHCMGSENILCTNVLGLILNDKFFFFFHIGTFDDWISFSLDGSFGFGDR